VRKNNISPKNFLSELQEKDIGWDKQIIIDTNAIGWDVLEVFILVFALLYLQIWWQNTHKPPVSMPTDAALQNAKIFIFTSNIVAEKRASPSSGCHLDYLFSPRYDNTRMTIGYCCRRILSCANE
jgi:hypothetical protein